MKGRMFCASQASTAICSSMDHVQKPTTTTTKEDERSIGRAIDRHNPIIKDGRRSCADDYIKIPSLTEDGEKNNKKLEIYKGRRSISIAGRKSTGSGGGGGGAAALLKLITSDMSLGRKSFSCVARPSCDFVNKTPPGSSRFLLGSDPDSLTGSAGKDPVKKEAEQSPVVEDKKPEEKSSCGGDGGSDQQQQVVVLKVSLHCRGCEGKVRKHLAKMQGVTSFNIDFAAKKVTVTGDITPLEILDSISKVKNAQFWTTPTLPMPNQTQNP